MARGVTQVATGMGTGQAEGRQQFLVAPGGVHVQFKGIQQLVFTIQQRQFAQVAQEAHQIVFLALNGHFHGGQVIRRPPVGARPLQMHQTTVPHQREQQGLRVLAAQILVEGHHGLRRLGGLLPAPIFLRQQEPHHGLGIEEAEPQFAHGVVILLARGSLKQALGLFHTVQAPADGQYREQQGLLRVTGGILLQVLAQKIRHRQGLGQSALLTQEVHQGHGHLRRHQSLAVAQRVIQVLPQQ